MSKFRNKLINLNIHSKKSEIDHLRILLFASVLYGFRVEKVFKPFPEKFIISKTNEPDILRLKASFQNISLKNIEETLKNSDSVGLLEHIFTKTNVYFTKISLKNIESPELLELLSKNITKVPATKPKYIFKIHYIQESFKNARFEQSKKEFGTFFAFHGTNLQNVRSIVEYGLVNVFNERQIYGEGIYLSSDISDTFSFSPFSKNFFPDSVFESHLSAILICEVVKHPKLFDKENIKNVPKNYHIIPNSDWIRIEALLLYSQTSSGQSPHSNSSEQKRFLSSFDAGFLFILSQFILLFVVGYYMTMKS